MSNMAEWSAHEAQKHVNVRETCFERFYLVDKQSCINLSDFKWSCLRVRLAIPIVFNSCSPIVVFPARVISASSRPAANGAPLACPQIK